MRFFEAVPLDYRVNQGVPKMPQRGTQFSAAYDIFSPIDIMVRPGETALIWTDIRASFKPDEVLLINVRSSMGKHPVMLANTQGWVDSDYYGNSDNGGNIGIMLHNLADQTYVIRRGDRIAQAMFVNCLPADGGYSTAERRGGFGSTNATGDA